jgi:hypothetical protein
MKPSVTWLLMGIGSGLVVGGGIRLAVEFLSPILARYIQTTSGREIGVAAQLFIVVGLPVLAVSFVIGWRVARPWVADIRAQSPTRPPSQSREPLPRWFALHLATVSVVAGVCVALLSGPLAAVVAVGSGVATRMAVTLWVALASE